MTIPAVTTAVPITVHRDELSSSLKSQMSMVKIGWRTRASRGIEGAAPLRRDPGVRRPRRGSPALAAAALPWPRSGSAALRSPAASRPACGRRRCPAVAEAPVAGRGRGCSAPAGGTLRSRAGPLPIGHRGRSSRSTERQSIRRASAPLN
jgi:hypothetical protein